MSISSTDVIAKDLQKLSMAENEGLVTLFELEIVPDDPLTTSTNEQQIFYFHGEKASTDITFAGNTYLSFPLQFTGMNVTSEGPSNRPTLTIPNVESVLKNNSKLDVVTGLSLIHI